jgi:hypothetical protein
MAGPRKKGSVYLAFALSVSLLALGACIAFGPSPDFKNPITLKIVNGGSATLFGIVLLWWAVSEEKDWGIGFETITMVVTVVTAVVAIFTLTHWI